MFRALLYFFLVYLAYQFIFKFLIPVYKTTQQVRRGVREMQDRVNESSRTQQSSFETKSPDKTSKEPIGDYIDFEEIK